MPDEQTLLTCNTQHLSVIEISHFYNTDELLYRKLQYLKIHVQAVSLLMFIKFFLYENNGSDNSIT